MLLCGNAAASDRHAYIAVVEKVAGAVGFYTEDGRQVGLVKVGPFPHEAVLSRDGKLLYVSVNGVLWMTEDKLGNNTLAVVDIPGMRKVRDIDLGRFHRPHGLALTAAGDRLLATTERPFGLILVDPAAGKVMRDYDVKGKSPHMVIPTPDGEWAYASDTDSDSVAAIRLKTGDVTLIPTGGRPQGGVLSSDARRLYIVNTDGNRISIIDTALNKVVGEIPTGKGPGANRHDAQPKDAGVQPAVRAGCRVCRYCHGKAGSADCADEPSIISDHDQGWTSGVFGDSGSGQGSLGVGSGEKDRDDAGTTEGQWTGCRVAAELDLFSGLS